MLYTGTDHNRLTPFTVFVLELSYRLFPAIWKGVQGKGKLFEISTKQDEIIIFFELVYAHQR